MADRLKTEPNSDGDVVFTPPELEFEQTPEEYASNHANVHAMMNNIDEVVRIDVVDAGNEDSAPLDPQHGSPTSELQPANLVDDGNRHNSQLEGDHANRSYGIYKLLNIYAVSQAGILAAASSARRRREGSLFVLSGLVSTSIIVVFLLKFSQQFRELPKEEYRTSIAQKAPIVVMLMAASVCILLSFA